MLPGTLTAHLHEFTHTTWPKFCSLWMVLLFPASHPQAIVDKSPVVASAALVSALHLLAANGEIVKRWVNEVQEAVQSKDHHVQFHAVALLHALRANDRLAISKLVTSLTKANVKSALAQVLLVRYVAQVRIFGFGCVLGSGRIQVGSERRDLGLGNGFV